MKTQNPIQFALLAAATLFTHATFAASGPKPPPPQPSSGTLVLDYAGPDGSYAYSWGLAVAPSGTIYALGNDSALDPDWSQLVLGSSDSGSTWSLLDRFVPPERFVEGHELGGGIALDSSGYLYVSGVSFGGPAERYVRQSTDGGASWTTVDNVVLPSPRNEAVGIAADAAGDVYVSGPVWATRKGVGGTLFSTVDSLSSSYAKDIFVHPTAGVFVVGYTQVTQKGSTVNVWLVRRSTDAGASWSTVDTFQLASGYGSVAMGVAANSTGIYVVGSGTVFSKGYYRSHWIVRKSSNGGNSWTTVDDYQLGANNPSEARCIATDPYGNVFVAGRGDAGQGYRWVVRKSIGGTGPWTTIDVFDAGVDANAIAASPSGNVFVGGGDSGGHWLIKKY